MRRKIFLGLATLSASLGIKLCHKVSKDYVEKHKDNPTTITKILDKGAAVINAIADALDLAIRATFIVAFS